MRHLKIVDENFTPSYVSHSQINSLPPIPMEINLEAIRQGLNNKTVSVWSNYLIIQTCIDQILNKEFLTDSEVDLLKYEIQEKFPALTVVVVPNPIEDSVHIAFDLNSRQVLQECRDSSMFLSEESCAMIESAMKQLRAFNSTLTMVLSKEVTISKVF